jgi:rhamnogalacturonyl hydrolase YesR
MNKTDVRKTLSNLAFDPSDYQLILEHTNDDYVLTKAVELLNEALIERKQTTKGYMQHVDKKVAQVAKLLVLYMVNPKDQKYGAKKGRKKATRSSDPKPAS